MFLIAIICRAMCAWPKLLIAISPMVPLQVISKSPGSLITCGVVVHLAKAILPFTKLLAPVTYGIPMPSALYSEEERSRPEMSCHTSFRRMNSHPSGNSKGISSSISMTSSPIFS